MFSWVFSLFLIISLSLTGQAQSAEEADLDKVLSSVRESLALEKSVLEELRAHLVEAYEEYKNMNVQNRSKQMVHNFSLALGAYVTGDVLNKLVFSENSYLNKRRQKVQTSAPATGDVSHQNYAQTTTQKNNPFKRGLAKTHHVFSTPIVIAGLTALMFGLSDHFHERAEYFKQKINYLIFYTYDDLTKLKAENNYTEDAKLNIKAALSVSDFEKTLVLVDDYLKKVNETLAMISEEVLSGKDYEEKSHVVYRVYSHWVKTSE